MKDMLSKLVMIFAAVLMLTACGDKEQPSVTSVNGVWQSIGSGWVLEVNDSTSYKRYDITSISCHPSSEGTFEEIQKFLTLNNDTLSMLTGVIQYQYTRISSSPDLCNSMVDDKQAQDPIYNFEVFAANVKEHYAFFNLNGINWEELYARQRAKLSHDSPDTQLYLTIEETLEELNDNHAFLEANDEVEFALEQLPEEDIEAEDRLPEYGDFQVAQMVAEHHMREDMTDDAWLVHWGLINDDIGFIQLKAMWLHGDLEIPQDMIDKVGYVDAYIETFHTMAEGDYIRKELMGINKTMDKVMKDLEETKSIVIDVRFNGGGQDAVSFEILSRFITQPLQVATQQLRYGHHHTPVQPLIIDGNESPYPGVVYVLTSPQTGSAAEALAISTMAMDNVLRIGSPTAGAMSTALEKTLPNGWTYSISNEVYMDNNGVGYENIGVPVDYKIAYPSDRQAFFRSIMNDLDADKQNILTAIAALQVQAE